MCSAGPPEPELACFLLALCSDVQTLVALVNLGALHESLVLWYSLSPDSSEASVSACVRNRLGRPPALSPCHHKASRQRLPARPVPSGGVSECHLSLALALLRQPSQVTKAVGCQTSVCLCKWCPHAASLKRPWRLPTAPVAQRSMPCIAADVPVQNPRGSPAFG